MHKSVAEHSDLIPDEHEWIFRKQKSLYMRREMARIQRFLFSDGSVKKINYPVLYESGITPPLCEVSAPEPDAGGKRIVAYVYKSSRSTVFENPDIVKTCTVRDLKKDFVNCDEKGEGQ